jgi:hypothetical protein
LFDRQARKRSNGHHQSLNVSLEPYYVSSLKRWKPAWFREDLSALLDLLRDKKIKLMIAERIPLSEARHAQELLGQGSQPLSSQNQALKAILEGLEPYKPQFLPEDASTG